MAEEREIVEMEEAEEAVEIVFDQPEPQEEEPDSDVPEDLRNLSRAEMAAMLAEVRAKADSAEALKAGIAALGEKLAPVPQVRAPEPVPTLDFTEEEAKEFDEKLFASADSPSKVVKNLLMGKVQRVLDHSLGMVAGKFAEQEEEILLSTSSEYKEWKPEIDKVLASLPEKQRNSPGVRKWALDQVKMKNIDKLVEREVKKRLEAQDAQASSSSSASAGGRILPPKQASASTSSAPGGKKVYVDRSSPEFLREVERATAKGVGPDSPMWDSHLRNVILPRLTAKKK